MGISIAGGVNGSIGIYLHGVIEKNVECEEPAVLNGDHNIEIVPQSGGKTKLCVEAISCCDEHRSVKVCKDVFIQSPFGNQFAFAANTIIASNAPTQFGLRPLPGSGILPGTRIIVNWGEVGSKNTLMFDYSEDKPLMHTYKKAGQYTLTARLFHGADSAVTSTDIIVYDTTETFECETPKARANLGEIVPVVIRICCSGDTEVLDPDQSLIFTTKRK